MNYACDGNVYVLFTVKMQIYQAVSCIHKHNSMQIKSLIKFIHELVIMSSFNFRAISKTFLIQKVY